MRRILATAALVFAWLCANGALLDVVQVFAWSRMFAGYSETMTVSAALRETFNPAKPCPLCRHVAKAKAAAQQQLPPAPEGDGAKFVLALETTEPPIFVREPGKWIASPLMQVRQRTEPVPVPPPRVWNEQCT